MRTIVEKVSMIYLRSLPSTEGLQYKVWTHNMYSKDGSFQNRREGWRGTEEGFFNIYTEENVLNCHLLKTERN